MIILFFFQLQYKLNDTKTARKTSISVIDAYIVHQRSVSTSSLVKINIEKYLMYFQYCFFLQTISPVTLDNNNETVIIITQPDIDSKVNSTNQLIISLMLRYALECAKNCQRNLQESIFQKIFYSLELPVNTCK